MFIEQLAMQMFQRECAAAVLVCVLVVNAAHPVGLV
jgi:hypothetical protein